MSEILNAKFFLFTLLYATFGALVMVAQNTSDYMASLPNTTLAGFGLGLAAFGGVVSYVWEKKQRKQASFRNNITFALGVGIFIGLISYDRLVVQNGMVNYWLGLLMAAGFANQMCIGLMALFARKRLKDFWGGESEQENNTNHDEPNSHGRRKRHEMVDK